MGRLVRIQRRQRAGRLGPGHQRVCGHAFRGGGGGHWDGSWRNGFATANPACWAAISGAVAGLVAITPASGFVEPLPALLIGLIAGIVCYFDGARVKAKLGYDDSLDAFGVHGAAERWARSSRECSPPARSIAVSKTRQEMRCRSAWWTAIPAIWNQLIGIAIAWALAIVGTLVILKICDVLIGLRVTEDQEIAGSGSEQHGEEGYFWKRRCRKAVR